MLSRPKDLELGPNHQVSMSNVLIVLSREPVCHPQTYGPSNAGRLWFCYFQWYWDRIYSMIKQRRVVSLALSPIFAAWLVAGALPLAAVAGEAAGPIESATFACVPKVLRTAEGPRWVVMAQLDSAGLSNAVVTAAAGSWGQGQPQPKGKVAAGKAELEFEIPPLRAGEPLRVEIRCEAGAQSFQVKTLAPPKQWTVYLTQHTHTDIGYTRPQTEILPESLRFLDYALDYCDLTDDYPDDAKFRWTCETFWAVRVFASPAAANRAIETAGTGRPSGNRRPAAEPLGDRDGEFDLGVAAKPGA